MRTWWFFDEFKLGKKFKKKTSVPWIITDLTHIYLGNNSLNIKYF
jgi:hypothetical protein